MIRSLLILYLSALGFLLPVLAQGTCVINDFEVQTNFVPEQFSGLWHLAGYNRMMRPVTRLPPRIAKITTRYVKSLYALGEDGRGTIRSTGQVTVTLRDGHNFTRCEDVDFSTHMEQGSRPVMDLIQTTGRRQGALTRSHIVETDYANYAVRYTCEHELPNGACAPNKDHLWILRKDSAQFSLTDSQIRGFMEKLCISGAYIESPMGPQCPFEDNQK